MLNIEIALCPFRAVSIVTIHRGDAADQYCRGLCTEGATDRRCMVKDADDMLCRQKYGTITKLSSPLGGAQTGILSLYASCELQEPQDELS